MDFDTSVKLNIYETMARTTRMPTSIDIALGIGSSMADVEQAFQRLLPYFSLGCTSYGWGLPNRVNVARNKLLL